MIKVNFKFKDVIKHVVTTAVAACLMINAAAGFAVVGGTSNAWAGSDPDIEGKTAVIYCGNSDEVVWSKKANKKMNPASMTKMMTCLIAIEELDLDKVVKVKDESSDPVYSGINFVGGEKVTVRNLLYAAMLASSNSAASALAIEVAGSEEKFAEMMNARAKAIGCTNTNFVNPHGLSDDDHYSTAMDIALICEEAFSNETLCKIAQTEKYTIKKTNKSDKRTFTNTNVFLTGVDKATAYGNLKVEKYEGIIGGKTGTTEDSQGTMAVALNNDGMMIYAVVMGSTYIEKFLDNKKMLDYGKENISLYEVFAKNKKFNAGKIWGGETNKITGKAANAGYINLPEGASESLVTATAVYTEKLEAPVEKGDKIGVIQIYLAEDLVNEVDLLAAESIEEGWFLSQFRITNTQTIIICVVLALMFIGAVTIMILRAINRRKRKQRRKQKIMEIAMRELEREKDLKQRNWPY